jgi:hypothetical protein
MSVGRKRTSGREKAAAVTPRQENRCRSFFRFSNSRKSMRSLIVVLLGVIASGSIAGGFWIAQLRESIATREKQLEADKRLAEVRDELHKQELVNATAVADIESRRLREKLSENARLNESLRLYVDRIDAVVGQHLNSDRELVNQLMPGAPPAPDRGGIPANAVLAAHLRASVDDTTAQIAVAKDWSHWVSNSSKDVASAPTYDSPSLVASPSISHLRRSPRSILFLSFSVLLALGIALVFGLNRLARTLLKKRRQLQPTSESPLPNPGLVGTTSVGSISRAEAVREINLRTNQPSESETRI